eukprot:scaffold14511_cov93-Cylindrotheca_fusiformis.AAC.3
MKSTTQLKSFAVLATLLASLLGLAILVVQNSSLNSRISRLNEELKQHQQNNQLEESKTTTMHVRTPSRRMMTEKLDVRTDGIEETSKIRNVRELSSKKSGKGGKGKGGKSSKRSSSSSSRDCSSSRTNDSAASSDDSASKAKCEDLRQLVFDLNTGIKDLEGETLRFYALADELQQTAVVAGADIEPDDARKRHLEEEEYAGQLEDSVRLLSYQETVLKKGNERVSELSGILRQSALNLLGLNANLSDENLALLQNITYLSQENFELLNSQTRLSEQISSLQSKIDTYQDLLDNHSDLNGELNQTTLLLEAEIDRLVAANEEYKKQNEELNETIADLSDQNTELANQNQILKNLNKDLNATIDRLDGEVQNDQLATEIDRLEDKTDDLESVNGELKENVADLQDEVKQFSGKVEELQKYNEQLENIVSFVNETGSFVNQTMDSVSEYLSDQIVAYRSVATETLQNTFIQRASLWDCAYRDHFGDEVFATNDNLPIPANKFNEVLNYVDNRVLDELCLSLNDFQGFLEVKFDDPIYTTQHIVSGIASYTYLAFDYYFPDAGDTKGLSEADWALAGYQCQRLPASKRFRHNGDV